MKDFFKDQFFKALEKNTIFSRADVQGNLIFVSDKLCQISGYSKKELIGKNIQYLNIQMLRNVMLRSF